MANAVRLPREKLGIVMEGMMAEIGISNFTSSFTRADTQNLVSIRILQTVECTDGQLGIGGAK